MATFKSEGSYIHLQSTTSSQHPYKIDVFILKKDLYIELTKTNLIYITSVGKNYYFEKDEFTYPAGTGVDIAVFLSTLKEISSPVITYPDGIIDSFSRMRVSQLTSQLDIKQLHDKLPLFIDEATNGTATSTHASASYVQMAVNASGDYVVRQTYQRGNYQSGKSHQVLITISSFQNQENVTKRTGYYSQTLVNTSTTDGIVIESANSTYTLYTYLSGTATNTVSRSSWDDPLDGTGKSGVNIDFEQKQILMLDFEWLGVGSVRFFVVNDGKPVLFHQMNNANAGTTPYMKSPNQPLRWEILQSGAGSGEFNHICATVGSEGSRNQLGVIRGISNGVTALTTLTQGVTYCLQAIRLKSTTLDTLVDVIRYSGLSVNNVALEFKLLYQPTIAGSPTWNSLTDSNLEYVIGTETNTVTGGYQIGESIYTTARGDSAGQLENALRLGSDISNNPTVIAFCVTPFANNAQAVGSIGFREQV